MNLLKNNKESSSYFENIFMCEKTYCHSHTAHAHNV